MSVSDLQFEYSSPTGQTFHGIVEYVGADVSNNLVLTVNTATGETTLSNASPFDVSIDSYSIRSESASLKPADGDWNSLADQGTSGWQESGPTAEALSELNPLGSLLLASGANYDMGNLLDPEGSRDLEFRFALLGKDSMDGIVVYQLTGDYNDDGTVDAADYTVWRDALATGKTSLLNRAPTSAGLVGASDYAAWKENFGNTAGDGVIGEPGLAVPEPSAGLLGLLMLAIAGVCRPGNVRRELK